jgi:hypothetical protein
MTTENVDRLGTAASMAAWVAEVLTSRGIDEIADWRMLEYWFQVELYRAVSQGLAGDWDHLGDYEQPYFTKLPRAKSPTKWIDLVFRSPREGPVQRTLWIELKDLGRNSNTLRTNAIGLGKDLAALRGIDRQKTLQQWRKPPPMAVDRGRLAAWMVQADAAAKGIWHVGQVAIVSKACLKLVPADEIEQLWVAEAHKRCKPLELGEPGVCVPAVARAETDKFVVLAVRETLATTRVNVGIPKAGSRKD